LKRPEPDAVIQAAAAFARSQPSIAAATVSGAPLADPWADLRAWGR
jgi:hypothetical protein